MRVYFIIVLTVVTLLSGCTPIGCSYPTACWKAYFRDTPCGTYVHEPCDKMCKACVFNEPVCQACWTCLERDGCGFNHSYCDILNYRGNGFGAI